MGATMNRRGHIVLLASVIVVAAILIVVSSLAFHYIASFPAVCRKVQTA